jgi:hypothetical protein
MLIFNANNVKDCFAEITEAKTDAEMGDKYNNLAR